MGTEDFIKLMRTKQGNRSLREFARSLNVSAAYLSDIYLGNRLPGPAVANPLGYNCAKTKVVTVVFTRRRAA
jgi:hypothetical protein